MLSARRCAPAALLLAAALLAPAPGGADEPRREMATQDLLVQIGRADYERYCMACHGAEGRGDGPVAPALSMPPSDLTRIAARRGGEFPVSEIAAYIDGREDVAAHGPREMPVWGQRFARRIHDQSTEEEVVRGRLLVLVEYLRSIQREGEGGSGGE